MDERNRTIPTVLIVLGATGDLMTKKIAPALFNLHTAKKLPPHFKLVGVSRREWSDEDLQKHLRAILEVKAPNAREHEIKSFLNLATYHKLTFDHFDDYVALNDRLKAVDDHWGMCANKLFYLSVPPQFYAGILDNLHKSHLTDGCGPNEGWTRVIVEKPFGKDEKSAKALDARLARLFKEEQIYRIDHYLAKETFQNILTFRFLNNLFEGNWGNEHIEKIAVREWENIGAEDRGPFYDPLGALRDVGQNHLLQMVALVTMEKPADMSAAAVRKARAEILETLVPLTREEVERDTFRAQYDGYRSIKGVAPDSRTETYFRLKGFLSHPRWEGVPIVMEAGKRLLKKTEGEVTEIEVIFRHREPCLCPPGKHYRNRIVFVQDPKEGIVIHFWAKKPGHDFALEERTFNFALRTDERAHQQYTEEYEKLLLDCIAGDQTLFISSEEIAAMWRFVDSIIPSWQKNLVPLRHYVPDSPAIIAEADVVMEKAAQKETAPRAIGLFGLGKMGANVARQLRDKGWHVTIANRSPQPVAALAEEGFDAASSAEELVGKISDDKKGRIAKTPRVVWLMITAGKGVDEFLFGARGKGGGLAEHLRKGDIVIDAGNSFYEDTMRRAKLLAKRGIRFLDVGFSGGPAGARHGGSLMVGGDRKAYEYLEPLFRDLSVPLGYAHFGDAGAGHFVKMVHNGIEYGMMQSLAEGFALMKKMPFKLDLQKVARVYNHGSVIESRLVGWLAEGFRAYGEDLKGVSGSVAATGEGEWTIKTGRKKGMELPAIEDAFRFRKQSQKKPSYLGKILSALRNRFGGHSVAGGSASLPQRTKPGSRT